MRIIAGIARGRRLITPKPSDNLRIRPTSDKAREAIFSILGSLVQGAAVLDLFAGTGAFGLEAMSRGADSVIFIDNSRYAGTLVKRNAQLCGFWERSKIITRDLSKGLFFLHDLAPASGFNIIFLDPPYKKELSVKILVELGKGNLLAAGGMIVAEEEAGLELPETTGQITLGDKRKYGRTGFWLYRANDAE